MEWLNSFSGKEQAAIIAAIISAVVSIITVFLKGGIDWIREDRHLRYKLKKEYTFKQRMQIKESLAKSKTPLIKSAEELNYRLWDFSDHIDEKWHSMNNDQQIRDRYWGYYLKSFVYRLLCFFYWIDRAEKDIYDFDFSVADESDQVYVKYVKTLENFFCEKLLIRKLILDDSDFKHHFLKNNISIFLSYIQNSDNEILPYDQFIAKLESGYTDISYVIDYIKEIKNDKNDPKFNIIMSFHLFLMLFLNKYGLDYQYTDRVKFQDIIKKKYKDNIVIKNELLEFFERNKIQNEVEWIIKDLGLETKKK